MLAIGFEAQKANRSKDCGEAKKRKNCQRQQQEQQQHDFHQQQLEIKQQLDDSRKLIDENKHEPQKQQEQLQMLTKEFQEEIAKLSGKIEVYEEKEAKAKERKNNTREIGREENKNRSDLMMRYVLMKKGKDGVLEFEWMRRKES